MTIDQAIEWLQDELPSVEKMGRTSLYAAIKLGIEALKRYKFLREITEDLLPGETRYICPRE
jgi:hypothetical protein